MPPPVKSTDGKKEKGKMNLERKTIEKDEEYLRQISVPVDFFNDDYKMYIEALKDYCKNNAVYALAPIQIGIPKRMIYFRNTTADMNKNKDSSYDEETVLINPSIISAKGHTRFLERCASCLDYVATIDRPYSVEVEYYDTNGKKFHETFEGFKATVFCHEFDHLNGVLHIDYADAPQKMTWEETRSYREAHPYEILSKDEEYHQSKNIASF